MFTVPKRRSGLGLRMRERALIEKLDEIFGEKHVQRPINRHAHFLFHAWQFAPVDPAPEKPGQKSGKIDAEDSRDAGATADRGQRTERFEAEWFFRCAINARDDVLRDNLSFARRVLRSWRTIFACRGIGHQCAVA